MEDNILMFEEYICKKRKSIPNPATLEENQGMLQFIVRDVLGLSAEEYKSLFSTDFNIRYKISKYIMQLGKISTEQTILGKQSKQYILSLIYPESVKAETMDDIFRSFDKNDVSIIKSLEKMQNHEKVDYVLLCYLRRLLKHVMCFSSAEEVYNFLGKAELLEFAEGVHAFRLIYRDYYCLLDFYYLNLSKERRERDFQYYIKQRLEIPDGLEIIKFSLKSKINLDSYVL